LFFATKYESLWKYLPFGMSLTAPQLPGIGIRTGILAAELVVGGRASPGFILALAFFPLPFKFALEAGAGAWHGHGGRSGKVAWQHARVQGQRHITADSGHGHDEDDERFGAKGFHRIPINVQLETVWPVQAESTVRPTT
jgi:hypothetical protein